MSKIPEDIQRTVAALCLQSRPVSFEDMCSLVLAERERCAKIAESCCWDFPEDRREAVQIETCDVIARAIRTPSTGEEQ